MLRLLFLNKVPAIRNYLALYMTCHTFDHRFYHLSQPQLAAQCQYRNTYLTKQVIKFFGLLNAGKYFPVYSK